MRRVESGVTRVVWVGKRWVIKAPRAHIFGGIEGARIVHGWFPWLVRGWLANQSEWRQRHRPDVMAPTLTLAHFVLVVRRARIVGTDIRGPWGAGEEWSFYGHGDECKPSSWGWYDDLGWRLIDYDRAWTEPRSIVGRLWYWNAMRIARRWAQSSKPNASSTASHVEIIRSQS